MEFQSTHPRGVRRTPHPNAKIIGEFQSTHPRGVRQHIGQRLFDATSFNPRTHEGCDILIVSYYIYFICFNPRTHEGCDFGDGSLLHPGRSFNPRTHEGCDRNCATMSRGFLLFQSTHPRGVRQASSTKSNIPLSVSIHAPTRGATQVLAPQKTNH